MGPLFAWKGTSEARDQEAPPVSHRKIRCLIQASQMVLQRALSKTGWTRSCRFFSHVSLWFHHESCRASQLRPMFRFLWRWQRPRGRRAGAGFLPSEGTERSDRGICGQVSQGDAHAGPGPAVNTRLRPRCSEREDSQAATTSPQAPISRNEAQPSHNKAQLSRLAPLMRPITRRR